MPTQSDVTTGLATLGPDGWVIPPSRQTVGSAAAVAFQASATGLQQPIGVPSGSKVIQATVSGTGSVSATVEVYGNTQNANSGGVLLATITLAGTNVATDGFAFDAQWPFVYFNLAAISASSSVVARLAV
jgi:hypothetical protein